MNMFFFKVETEYGLKRDLLASAWTEFNAAMTKEIVHLLPEEKQASNLHVTRCHQPITKGGRAGQTCNRSVAKGETVCKIHAKAAAKAAAETTTTAVVARYCKHVTDVDSGKTCTRRVTGTATICTSHRKFYGDDDEPLPTCTAIIKSSNKKCNRVAENGNKCKMHGKNAANRHPVSEPEPEEYVDVDDDDHNSDIDMDDMDAAIDADIERSLAEERGSDSESDSESKVPTVCTKPRAPVAAKSKPKKKRAPLAKAPKNLQSIEESDENDE